MEEVYMDSTGDIIYNFMVTGYVYWCTLYYLDLKFKESFNYRHKKIK